MSPESCHVWLIVFQITRHRQASSIRGRFPQYVYIPACHLHGLYHTCRSGLRVYGLGSISCLAKVIKTLQYLPETLHHLHALDNTCVGCTALYNSHPLCAILEQVCTMLVRSFTILVHAYEILAHPVRVHPVTVINRNGRGTMNTCSTRSPTILVRSLKYVCNPTQP